MSEDTKPKYKIDDEVTASRGKHRGKTGTVIAVDTEDETYAVKLADGKLIVLNFVNVKEPVEPTYTRSQIVEALTRVSAEDAEIILAALPV